MDIESQISALSEAVELLQKSVSCSICLEIMVNPTRTKCGHSFCHGCIMTVINKNRMANCPLCNSKINRRTVKENEKAKIMVERVLTVINNVGKDLGMDIIAHAKVPKSTQEALLSSPKVQRVLRQSKLEQKPVWQKSDLKCKNKPEKLVAKEKQLEKTPEHTFINQETASKPNEKEVKKENERVKTPELVSVSQILPLSPPTTDEKVSHSIRRNVEEVPRKQKVAEWLDKAFDTTTSGVESLETEDKEKSEQMVVVDVHKTEDEELKSVPQQRVRCYKISKKKAMVFTDAENITVDSEGEENNKKRKIENSDDNEIEAMKNAECDPYTFIGSQKTPAKPTRKSSRYKENKSSSASSKTEMQKKKPKIMAAKPLPVRYNESQTLSIDIYDTFDKLVATANKTEPPAPKEELSDSDDTVFLFRTPLESTSKNPGDLDVHMDSVDGSVSLHDKKHNNKVGCQRRTRSKSIGTSKPSIKTETGSRNIKQMFEESKANLTTPLSPSKKINQTINGISIADGDIKNIPAAKSLILDEAVKEEIQVLEKENLIDVIEPATPVSISKLNATLGTKSPGWSRISKSRKEFDKLKKRECAALNVSGGVATKRNKITDSLKNDSSDTLIIPPVEDTQNAVDLPISTTKPDANDSPKTVKLGSTKIAEDGQVQKELGEDNFPKPDVSLIKQKSFNDTFSDIGILDSPASHKRKIHIKSLIAFLSSENEGSKIAEPSSLKDPEGPAAKANDQTELKFKEQAEQLQNTNVGLNSKPQQEIGANEQQAPLEIKVSPKDENGVKKTLMPTSEVVKAARLSHSVETVAKQTGNEDKKVQTNKDLDKNTTEECGEKHKRYVTFVKKGRFNRLTKHIPFILLGKLTAEKRSCIEDGEELQHNAQKNKSVTNAVSPVNASVQTSPTQPPSPEKRTLEFVGCEDSQACNFVAGSCDTMDFPNVIPLPRKKSADVLQDPAFFSSSQADDIPTQKFHPPPPTKKPDTEVKLHKEGQKSGSNSGSKLTLSQFSNATTVRYNRSGSASLDNSPEMCNYSPDKSLSFLEDDNPKEIKASDAVMLELSNEVSSGHDSDIKMPFRGKTVNRRLDFVPKLTDPALDAFTEMQTKDTKKPFKRIRSPSSSDSDSETLVPEISDVHSSGSKRAKRDDEEEDIEVVNLISSQENNATKKAESEIEIPNSAELMARVMANIEADLAVKQNRTNHDCEESEMEEDRDTPIMFTPTEYFGSQIGNSCSTDFQPNSAASSEAIILGTLQQENQFEVKPKAPTSEKSEAKVNVSPQGPSAANKTSDGDCESDEGIVQPTPSKDNSANSRNAKTSWGPSELRSMSIGALCDVLKEPEDFVKYSENAVGNTSLVQPHKTDTSSSFNSLSTQRFAGSSAVEKPTELKESAPKITTEAAQVEKTGSRERTVEDVQSTSKTMRAVSKTPEVPKKVPVKPCFVCSGLPAAMIAQVKSLANIVNADFSNTFIPNTTHLILKDAEDNLAYKTLKYLYAVVRKTWVVSFSWVSDCVRARRLLPEDDYEMLDSSGENGPYRARNSTDLLLTNFEFCCIEPYTDITKEQLEELLKESGASVVNSPEEIKFRPGVYNMILVQMDAKTEEEVQYWWDKYGVITVAHEWVLDSIGRYRVIPIWPYLMSDIEEEHLQALGYPDVLLATDELEPESQA